MDIKINNKSIKKEFFIVIIVLFFSLTSYIQYNRTKELKRINKEMYTKNKILDKENKMLSYNIKTLGKEKETLLLSIDSLNIERLLYKTKYINTYAKLKKTILDYNTASSNDKDKLFTDAINN